MLVDTGDLLSMRTLLFLAGAPLRADLFEFTLEHLHRGFLPLDAHLVKFEPDSRQF
jgi:hypothetical protein